jgi:hypothetical protein
MKMIDLKKREVVLLKFVDYFFATFWKNDEYLGARRFHSEYIANAAKETFLKTGLIFD